MKTHYLENSEPVCGGRGGNQVNTKSEWNETPVKDRCKKCAAAIKQRTL